VPSKSAAAEKPADPKPLKARLGRDLRTQIPLAAGFLLLFAIGAASIWLILNGQAFNDSVARTLQIRSDAYRLLTLIQDAETGQRGYLITEDETYLRPYEAGIAEIPKALEELRRLTSGNPKQRDSIAALSEALVRKLTELSATVASAKAGDRDGAIKRVKNNVGNRLMEAIRGDVARIEAEEERTETQLSQQARTTDLLLGGVNLGGVLVVCGLAALVISFANRSTRQLLAAQQQLETTNSNLEVMVADRVSELQAANEEIQRFAYIVSHDLRAPLVNVMGFTSELDSAREEIAAFFKTIETKAPELVSEDARAAIDTDLPEALGFIRTSTAKMDRLINAILKLSREGRRVLTPEPIDLVALVTAQGESLSQQLAAGDAELKVAPELPDLVSDRLAIEQIFGNLIENAVKYLKPGRPGRIEVTGSRKGAYLTYQISDNGRGIETKDFERVFELFRRAGEQDKPGEGIGLAYVRNLARRLGGNVSVQSVFGEGSTFTVTLPAVFSTKAKTR
jgi:signal transduction histidine kinase